MKNSFSTLALAAVLALSAAACGKMKGAKPTPEDGTSSGGGSFGDESSLRLLNTSKKVVADMIRHSNPNMWQGLPQGWTQERLAKLVENTRTEPNRVVYRYGRELMFNYRVPKSGEPYLVATSLYFRSHAAIPVNSLDSPDMEPYIREVRTKLLHEAAHVMGVGLDEKTDYKARAFAFYLIRTILLGNNIVCTATDVPKEYPGAVPEETLKKEIQDDLKSTGYISGTEAVDDANVASLIKEKLEPLRYRWFINRATGFGMQTLKSYNTTEIYQSWYEKMMKGERVVGMAFVFQPYREGNPNARWVEPRREWISPYWNFMPKRMYQQHYSDVRISGEKISYSGGESQASINGEPCSTRESIVLPVGHAPGAYKGYVEFKNSCHDLIANSDRPAKEIHQFKIEVDCIEGYERISNLDQFFGSGELKDPELIEATKNRNSL